MAVSDTSIESLKTGDHLPHCVLVHIPPQTRHREAQSTEARELESNGARDTGLSGCPAGLLCADRQFHLPTPAKRTHLIVLS